MRAKIFFCKYFWLVPLLLFGVVGSAVAAPSATLHGLRIEADGAYLRETNIGGNGAAVELGVGYRLTHNHFLFDVGVGGRYAYVDQKMGQLNDTIPGVDEEGLEYMGYHVWKDRRSPSHRVEVNVPIRVGGEWGRFYFLVGAKANVGLWGRVKEEGKYSLSAMYERYIDPFSSMPNHDFVTDEPYENDPEAIDMNFDIRAVAEVGYAVAQSKLSSRSSVKMNVYVSAFAEYAVWHSSYYTPLLVGAKCVLVFNLPNRHGCNCLGY